MTMFRTAGGNTAVSQDAGIPQTEPTCHLHVGRRTWQRKGLLRGVCDGCRREDAPLDLLGRVRPHEPGPPPFTWCASCGVPLRPPRYNALDQCPGCYETVERESTERGDTAWEWPDE